MADVNHLDDEFLRRAQAQRMLSQGQVAALRHELRRRRPQNPAINVADLAVEKGMLDAVTVQVRGAGLSGKPQGKP